MPGILGIVDTEKKIHPPYLTDNMFQVLRHDKSYKDYLFISDHCVMGGIALPYFDAFTQQTYNEDKTLCLIMEGEIFNCDELRKDLQNKGFVSTTKNYAEIMLSLYKAYGVDLVHKVNGCFILAIWDTKNKIATLINDRFGTYPLYYSTCNNCFLFAPEMKALLCDPRVKRTLDPSSVADYFSFGFILRDKSFIEDIKLMPSGNILRYNDNKLSIEAYWDFPFQENYPTHSTRHYIEEFDYVLDRAVERQTRKGEKFGIGLSGGLDSRIIAGFVNRKVSPISTFTFGDPKAHDVIYAKRVSAAIKSSHKTIKYNLNDFFGSFNKMVWLMEGLINTSEYYYLARAMQGQVDTAFSGTAGETLSGKYLTKAICKAKNKNTVINLTFPWYKGRLPDHDPENLFSKEYYKFTKGVAIRNFNETFSKISSEIPANIHLHHLMKNKVFPEWARVNSLPSLYLRLRYPFLDYEVIDFFLRLPPSMRLNQKVYKALLIDIFPELAAIPRDARTYAIRWEPYLNKYCTIRNDIGHFLLKKWYPIFKSFDPRGSANIHNVEAYRGPLKDKISSIILEGNNKRRYFAQNYLEKILSEHFHRKKNNSFMIHKLISFELFHRLFLDDSRLVSPD